MNGFLIFLLLLGCGFFFGRAIEHRHYRSLARREKRCSHLRIISTAQLDSPAILSGGSSQLVHGCAVISVDYYKRVLAFLKNIVGGQLGSYESLLDRARREAVLRMQESCPGAEMIVNLRIETSSIYKGGKNQVGCVEVLAYGTAIYPAHWSKPDKTV